MNPTKLIGELANDVFDEANEIRTLSDAELIIPAGGDQIFSWNPPPPPPPPAPGP